MRPRTVRRIAAACVVACLVLAGCAGRDGAGEKEVLEPYPIVLSAQEVGPGYALTGNDFSLKISLCGANTNYPPARADGHYIAQYTNGARVVAVGIWPARGHEKAYVPSANRRIDDCLSLPPKEWVGNDNQDYVIERLEGYPDEVLAFQSVAWQATGYDPLPISRDDYVNNPHVIAISTARAFGIFEDHFITVMIDDPSDQPPTEEELRALWDAQVAKMRYHYAIQTTHKLLAPPPGLDSAQSQEDESN